MRGEAAMLETELKTMLDEETYLRIERMFDWDWVKEQVNSYYTDPMGDLKRNGITLRVRTKDGINKIQVKAHKNAGSPLQICEETEFCADGIPELFTEEQVGEMTGIYAPAVLLGSLATLRHSLMYDDSTEICLDRSEYLGKIDYELEVEYTAEPPEELLKALAEAGAVFAEPAVGKCTRFMRRLAEV